MVEEAFFKDRIIENYKTGHAEDTADKAQDRID